MINTKAPYPQANDFNKIVKIINVSNPDYLKDYGIMQMLLGDITARQVDYYISACQYLGLITEEKSFTPDGEKLRKITGVQQLAELARLAMYDKSIGSAYFQQKFLGIDLANEDIVAIMKDSDVYFDSEPMYKRRASTISSWIKWIISQEEK